MNANDYNAAEIMIEEHQIIITNDILKDAHFINDNHKNKLVKIKKTKFTGVVEHVFTLYDDKLVAVGNIYPQQNDISFQDLLLDNSEFRGFIIKDSRVKVLDSTIKFVEDSKLIDQNTIYHINFKVIEDKYFKIKDKSSENYGKAIQQCKINQSYDAIQFKNNILSKSISYVKISDIEIIATLDEINTYYNHVILKPQNILKFETKTYENFKLKDIVKFSDSKSHSYHGQLVWLGEINESKAALIALNDDVVEPDIPFKLDKNFMNTNYQKDAFGIFVGFFALHHDSVTYLKLKEGNLEVIDHKYEHTFRKEPFKEKIILFNISGVQMIATLKWKGCIYNELSIGCEMNQELSEGSNGTYGTQKLFTCANKKGFLITWSKSKSLNIELCEFDSKHKELEKISTKFGFDIYDVNSICCVERLDKVDSEKHLKIGCKILFQNQSIGQCGFIGKINGRLSIGIPIDFNFIIENHSVLDFIYLYTFNHKRLCFLDFETIKIGSFYQETHCGSIAKEVKYYPEHGKCISGEVKWFGKHENGNEVCGIELDEEIREYSSKYFFENLFDHKDKHGIIDDDSKIEYVECHESSTKSIDLMGNLSLKKDEIIKCLLGTESEKHLLKYLDDLCSCYSNEFVNFLKENKQILTPQNFPQIILSFYKKNKSDAINSLLCIEETRSIIYSLSSLIFSDFDVGFFDLILPFMTINSTDENNEFCLRLALKCLETINQFEEPNESDNQIKTLFNKVMEKCTNPNCFINKDLGTKETFITEIIKNESISEKIIINVLKLRKFDIDKRNLKGESPLKLSIILYRPEILSTLLELNCQTDDLCSFQREEVNLPSVEGESCFRYEVLKIITRHLANETSTAINFNK